MVDPRAQQMERLRAALAAQGMDPDVALQQIPALAQATSAEGMNDPTQEVGRQLVRLRRFQHPNAPGSPASDGGWDRFFGAMQVQELRNNAAGRNFAFDPSGFGTTMAQDLGTGKYYNNDQGEIAPGQLPTKERNAYYAERPDEALKGAQAVRRFRQNQSVPVGRI